MVQKIFHISIEKDILNNLYRPPHSGARVVWQAVRAAHGRCGGKLPRGICAGVYERHSDAELQHSQLQLGLEITHSGTFIIHFDCREKQATMPIISIIYSFRSDKASRSFAVK